MTVFSLYCARGAPRPRFGLMALGMLVCVVSFLVGACHTSASTRDVDFLMEPVRVAAPQRPKICRDKARPIAIEQADARATLYVFSANWCRACERLLGELEQVRGVLVSERIALRNIVTGEGESCMRAAAVARSAAFPYGVAPGPLQQKWRVRSTPTVWLVDVDGTALLYVEGEPEIGVLLEEIRRRIH